ncbi:hypothetical protein BJV74DRAFT_874803 [Russula compacta]|nr:hypothetical protein BJV74DRAFT_874803 [Russula compacta]
MVGACTRACWLRAAVGCRVWCAWGQGLCPPSLCVCLPSLPSSGLPLCPWLSTDSSLFQEVKKCDDSLWVVKEL